MSPLTKTGAKVLAEMKKEYGNEQGKKVFYSSINANKSGSDMWEGKKHESMESKMMNKKMK